MKKLFQLPFLAMACVFMSGCTSDYEFEDGQSAKEQKALEVKAKIQELAEDYGLRVQLLPMADDKLSEVNLDSVTNELKSLAALRGTYRLVARENQDGQTAVLQEVRRVAKRKLSVQSEGYEFEEQTIGNYTCHCELSYDFSDEKGIHNIETDAYLSCSSALGSSSDGTRGVLDGMLIKVSGHVSYYFDSGNVVTFLVDGEYDCVKNDGWIIWY